jgi:short-subunit dehydrogenase
MRNPRSIVITGASSGLGAALAETYAGAGVYLALTGRHAERLAAVATACRQRGAEVTAVPLEVTDQAAMSLWLHEIDHQHPIDLVIANAGISAGTGRGGEGEAQTRAIFAVNLEGVLNTILPVLPALAARRRGQLALVSSLASFRGVPGAPAYCASKAAVRVWGEALRGEVRDSGIEVSVICPGFVVSQMTAGNDFPMPLLMSAQRAARIIRRGLDRGRARIAFPWPLYAAAWLLAALPPRLTDPLLGRLPKKKSAPSG